MTLKMNLQKQEYAEILSEGTAEKKERRLDIKYYYKVALIPNPLVNQPEIDDAVYSMHKGMELIHKQIILKCMPLKTAQRSRKKAQMTCETANREHFNNSIEQYYTFFFFFFIGFVLLTPLSGSAPSPGSIQKQAVSSS